MSEESNKTPAVSNNIFATKERRIGSKFVESCLKETQISFNLRNVVNLFVVHELDTWSKDLITDFTLVDCLFGTVKLTNNAEKDKYDHSGSDIGFDVRSLISKFV